MEHGVKKQRRHHSPQFKAKMALEAAKEERTVDLTPGSWSR